MNFLDEISVAFSAGADNAGADNAIRKSLPPEHGVAANETR